MENLKFLEHIDFKVDRVSLRRSLHIGEEGEDAERLEELVMDAERIGRPKVLYGMAYIQSKEDDSITIDGIKFSSRILRVNLEQTHRVFPYIMTCGNELEEWSNALDDFLERYWADIIKEMALACATTAFNTHLKENFNPGPTADMNPGSLEDWPIMEQKALFALLGDSFQETGVELTESFLMLPVKSVSGIRFSTDADYKNCQLCPRRDCPGRRSPYDASLYERKYRM